MADKAATPEESTPTEDGRVGLDQITPDPANVRLHPQRNMEAIHGSLVRFGAARSVVVDKDGVVRAGSGTLEAAKAAGIKTARIIDADGSELIVVRRPDWSDAEAAAYAIADNRSAEQAEWDRDPLARMLQALRDGGEVEVEAMGFIDSEVDDLLIEVLGEQSDGDDQTPFGQFDGDGVVDDGFVAFKFGDYAGKVAKEVYDLFVGRYKAAQAQNPDAVMLDDVVRTLFAGGPVMPDAEVPQ